jgi:hypothetical protein
MTEPGVDDFDSGDFEQRTYEPEPEQGKPAEDALGDAGKQAIDRMKAEKADAVKQMKALQKELDQFKQASLSDAERAVAEAKTEGENRGRASAMSEIGAKLARASFDAMAARRNPAVDTGPIVEYVDLAKFLDENGDVNKRSLQAAVDRLVPEAPAGPPSFDGGVRTSTKTANMNDIIRSQALGGRSA